MEKEWDEMTDEEKAEKRKEAFGREDFPAIIISN